LEAFLFPAETSPTEMREMSNIGCVVLDAGARYGLHPSWADLRGIVEFHLFEMDEVEAKRLTAKYRNDAGIKVYPLALYSADATLEFAVSEHQALNSLFETNTDLLDQHDYMKRDFASSARRKVEARSVDSVFAGAPVHFMKLDCEGAEFDILKGAAATLDSTVLGVRSEVLFAEVYKGAALFGELNAFMIARGFELLNLDYAGAGNKGGKFTTMRQYGRLISSDAVWTVGNDRLWDKGRGRVTEDVVRMALFLMNNGATDIAVETLLRAVTREGVSFEGLDHDPVFKALHRKALLLFKSLQSLPQLTEEEIASAYRTIFNREFPLMNRFYESDIFA
jgi:FkbM family methyltransferase